jgi:predicted DNA binding protein
MRHARLRVELPESAVVHVHRALVESDRVTAAHLLSGGVRDEDTAYRFYVEGDREPVVAALEADDVADYEVAALDDDHLHVHVSAARPAATAALSAAITEGSLVATLPVVLRADGSVEVDVVGTAEDLRTAVEELPLPATVERVGDRPQSSDPGDVLTARQREVVETALSLGHYERPREATHEDVAAALDLAAATVSEHLRRAETRLVRAAFE